MWCRQHPSSSACSDWDHLEGGQGPRFMKSESLLMWFPPSCRNTIYGHSVFYPSFTFGSEGRGGRASDHWEQTKRTMSPYVQLFMRTSRTSTSTSDSSGWLTSNFGQILQGESRQDKGKLGEEEERVHVCRKQSHNTASKFGSFHNDKSAPPWCI